MKSKETLRKTIKSKRQFIEPDDAANKSRQIYKKLSRLNCLKKASTLLIYLSKPEEVDTRRLIEWSQKRGISVLVPVTSGHGQMAWSRLSRPFTLKNGPYGIPVPAILDMTPPPPEAPVIIPCIAFAENGHRIGHGAGFYDRFLAKHDGLKIALAFEVQLVPDFETDEHDIPMDVVVTESALYNITDAVFVE